MKFISKINNDYKNKLDLENNKYESKDLLSKSLNSYISELKVQGFAEANIDTLFYEKNIAHVDLHVGVRYSWGNINLLFDNDSDDINMYKLLEKYHSKYFSSNNIRHLNTNLIKYLADKSYPFAAINLKNIAFNDTIINAYWQVSLNNSYAWDSLVCKGTSKLKKSFLYSFLGIKINKSYSESDAKAIDDKLSKLPFVELLKASEYEFDSLHVKPFLYLNSRKVNQFDGIMGLYTDKKSSKINLTGEINIKLINAFSAGEKILFNWMKLEENSQKLNLSASYPFIFNTNIGVGGNLSILKQDSLYIKTSFDVETKFFLSGLNNISVFYNSESSDLLSSKIYVNTTVLPRFIDSKIIKFGIAYEFSNLDYFFNPRKGISINISTAFAKRQVKINKNIPLVLYKDLLMNENLLFVNLDLQMYKILFKDFVLHTRAKIAGSSSSNLFDNEQISLGGLKNLRGFDQDFYKPKCYSLLSNELRFIPEKNTAIYVFCDMAYTKFKSRVSDYTYMPFSFGFGVNFSTNVGVFSLNYALGKYKNESIDIDKAKVHFGFITRF